MFVFVVSETFSGATRYRRGGVLDLVYTCLTGFGSLEEATSFCYDVITPPYFVQYERLVIWNIISAVHSVILLFKCAWFNHAISY